MDDPDYDCSGCGGGDKWPIGEDYFRCPVCDTEFYEEDDTQEDKG